MGAGRARARARAARRRAPHQPDTVRHAPRGGRQRAAPASTC